jgi:hypothetical protein
VFVRALLTVTSTTRRRRGAMESNHTTSPYRSLEAPNRIRGTSSRKSHPLVAPRFKHELFKHVDNPIVELNHIPSARAPGGAVHKHSSCGVLTRHRSTRYRRRKSRPTRLWGGLTAPWALPKMRGALYNKVQHTVRCHRIVIGRHLENSLT